MKLSWFLFVVLGLFLFFFNVISYGTGFLSLTFLIFFDILLLASFLGIWYYLKRMKKKEVPKGKLTEREITKLTADYLKLRFSIDIFSKDKFSNKTIEDHYTEQMEIRNFPYENSIVHFAKLIFQREDVFNADETRLILYWRDDGYFDGIKIMNPDFSGYYSEEERNIWKDPLKAYPKRRIEIIEKEEKKETE